MNAPQINEVNEPEKNYGLIYRELYLREKEAVDLLREHIKILENKIFNSNILNKVQSKKEPIPKHLKIV